MRRVSSKAWLRSPRPTDRQARSVLKAVSYRVCSLTADALILYGLTHSVTFSAGVVALMNTGGTVLYYLHERVWAQVAWGTDREA